MSELSEALAEIEDLNPWSKEKGAANIEDAFGELTEDFINLVLSINSEAYQNPANKIATNLRSFKKRFEAFKDLFIDFSDKKKLIGGAIIAKEALDHLAGPFV